MNLRNIEYYKDIFLSILILHNIYLSKIWKLSWNVVSIVIIQEGIFISSPKWRKALITRRKSIDIALK